MSRRLLRPTVLIPAFVLLSLAGGLAYAAFERVGTSAAEENSSLLESLPLYPGAREAARRAQTYDDEGGLPLPEGVVTTVVYVPPPDATQEEVVRFYLSRLDGWDRDTTTIPAPGEKDEDVYRVQLTRGENCLTLMTYGMAPSAEGEERSYALAASTEQGGCG